MRQRVLAAVVTAALWGGMTLGASSPAFADGQGSTTTIIILGAAAVGSIPLVVNYNHKVREKRAEQQEVTRRQDAYRDWFYQKYNYYPTEDQFKQWYVQTYGTAPGAAPAGAAQPGTPGAQPAAQPAASAHP